MSDACPPFGPEKQSVSSLINPSYILNCSKVFSFHLPSKGPRQRPKLQPLMAKSLLSKGEKKCGVLRTSSSSIVKATYTQVFTVGPT